MDILITLGLSLLGAIAFVVASLALYKLVGKDFLWKLLISLKTVIAMFSMNGTWLYMFFQ